VLLDEPDDCTGGRPEVHRGALRQILLDSLPADTIKWGYKANAVRSLGGGRHEVTFADGATVETGLLVGADGAWSRIRPLLSDATPEYVGISFIETYLFDGDTRHPASAPPAVPRRRGLRAVTVEERRPTRAGRSPYPGSRGFMFSGCSDCRSRASQAETDRPWSGRRDG
jgi:2-polyprenyl-6-methoxyphenol hydroxylase-like FAD-dependent oxidoreductase